MNRTIRRSAPGNARAKADLSLPSQHDENAWIARRTP